MLRRRVIVWVLLGLALAGCSSAKAGPSNVPRHATSASAGTLSTLGAFPDADFGGLASDEQRRLHEALESFATSAEPLGMTAALIAPDGRWQSSWGRSATGEALGPTASFAIGDVTQLFTAAEVLYLVEHGRVDLDASLSSYVALPPQHQGVTVRAALARNGGLPECLTDEVLGGLIRSPVGSTTGDEGLACLTTPAGAAQRSSDRSRTSYLLLGRLVEQVTGGQFGVSDVVNRILESTRIVVQDPERPRRPLARADVPGGDTTWYLPSRSVARALGGSGGMAADAEDLALWGYALYGGSVLKLSTLREMTHAGPDGVGLGSRTMRLASGTEVLGLVGHLPGYSAILAVQPERAVSVAVLADEGDIPVDQAADALLTALSAG